MPYKDKEKRKAYQKKYQVEWYKNNKKEHLQNVKATKKIHRERNKKFVNDYKEEEGCCNCPEDDICCLDFHHLSDDKEKDVSAAVCDAWSLKRLKKEMDKCVVICANCHRKLHFGKLIL